MSIAMRHRESSILHRKSGGFKPSAFAMKYIKYTITFDLNKIQLE